MHVSQIALLLSPNSYHASPFLLLRLHDSVRKVMQMRIPNKILLDKTLDFVTLKTGKSILSLYFSLLFR